MKHTLLFILIFTWLNSVMAQSLLEDSETPSPLNMIWTSGTFQRGVENPMPDQLNSSLLVSKHTRSNAQYDVFLYNAISPALDVGPYKSGIKKMAINFYSEHPGTVVQITLQCGQKASAAFPAGRHSEYKATTTKTNEWETLIFNYVWTPDATTTDFEIDQFAFLIDPDRASSAGRIYHFDNFAGPDVSVPDMADMLYEDAEAVSYLDYIYTGILTKNIDNPAQDGENTSQKVLQYERSTTAYDVLVMNATETVLSVEPFSASRKKMSLQVYSAAPGTEIVLTLANSSLAEGQEYPVGRHSDYRAYTTKTNEWETVVFDFVYRPDNSVPHMGIDQFVLTIAPNTTTTSTFYLDNFYGPDLFISSGTVNLHINEIMSSNSTTISDFEGDNGDWIEIYNSGDGSANLKGYFLSDNTLLPGKFVFPDAIIHPGDYLLVWASDKNRLSPDGEEVHTNFKISSAGESILLLNPQGDTVDFVPAVQLAQDVSYGRSPDAGADWTYFQEATPDASNTTESFEGFITEIPAFSHQGGFYETPIDLSVTGAGDAAYQIRYTLDGSDPDINSPLLSQPLHIESRKDDPNILSNIRTTYVEYINWFAPEDTIFKATTVKARIFKDGQIPGPVVTNSYFVDETIMSRYTVPVWSIVTDSSNLFDHEKGIYVPGKIFEDWQANNPGSMVDGGTASNYTQRGDLWERPASFEYFEPGGERGFRVNAGLRIHGGWSRGNGQKSLRIHFKGQYDSVDVLNYPIFTGLKRKSTGEDLTKFKRLILRNSGGDNGFTVFRDALAHSLITHTSVAVQAYRPSVVFLNGDYWGIQNIRERIDDEYLGNHFNVDNDDIAILSFNGTVEEGTQEDANNYQSLLTYVRNNNMSNASAYQNVKNRMDVENYADYQATEIYLDNTDWPGNNILFWRNRNGNTSHGSPGMDGRWRWILIDTDFGMGWLTTPDNNTLAHATETGNTEWPNPDWSTFLFRTLLQNEEFKNTFINRTADHLNSSFKPELVNAQIDQMKATLQPLMDEHIQRWNTPDGIPTWDYFVQEMKTFAAERPGYLRQHVIQYFGLSGTEVVTLDVHNNTGGEIKISSLRLNENTQGISVEVYPWTGTYFKDVPVQILAIPDPGYKFTGWNGNASTKTDTVVELQNAISLTAYFEPIDANENFPLPHILAQGRYTMNNWPASSEAHTYPASMIFMQSDTIDPGLDSPMHTPYTQPYNLSEKTRIEGLNDKGFAFINTGTSSDTLPGTWGRDLGSAILALNTTGVSSASISFTAGTVLRNDRPYAIRLQYRAGNSGDFTDILLNGEAVEYYTQATDGHSTSYQDIPLPAEALDQPYVQLRWIYYHSSGNMGPRAKLRLDDIVVKDDNALAVKTAVSTTVSVYPNPTREQVNLKLRNSYTGPVSVSITDPTGKVLATSELYKSGPELSWKSARQFTGSGIFFVHWETEEEKGVERVLILSGK